MNERPLTPRARKVLDLAQAEAGNLGRDYVGTDHILLGLVAEGTGVAARVLVDFDVEFERVRAAVIRIVGQGAPPNDSDRALLVEIRDTLVRIADALEASKRN
jgi:ATP-dependent Clp protease ATP-binding subunit ClpC